jgi:dihydropteroate synthase
VVGEVRDFLVERAGRAREAGVSEVWVDPGIGFGKTVAHNLLLLRHLRSLVAAGYPVVVGTSRKSFIGRLTAGGAGDEPLPPDDRLEGSLATAAWSLTQGATMVRVHDVRPTVQLARLVDPESAVP